MTSEQLNNIFTRIDNALNSHCYSMALLELKSLAEATASSWGIRNRIAKLDENLSYLKKYAIEGYPDPSRKAILSDLVKTIKDAAIEIRREIESKDNPSVYFSTLRYERMKSNDSITSLLNEYSSTLSEFSLAKYGFSPATNVNETSLREIGNKEERIFNRIWTTHPLSQQDARSINAAVCTESASNGIKRLLLSAVLLGGMTYYDETRLDIAINAYEKSDETTSIRSLCVMLLLLWRWREIPLSEPIKAHLSIMCDDPGFRKEVKMVFMQFIRTRDTERINRKVNDEIIPRVTRLRPDLQRLSEMQDLTDAMAIDENPEWGEMLRNSGIEEQLKQLNDMQLDGADVMMSTFSHLKSFHFFNNVVNWFRQFNIEYAQLYGSPDSGVSQMMELIVHSSFLCESDKYSLALSLDKLPSEAFGMLKSQLASQNIDFAEMASSMTGHEEAENVANKYMQDIYRFYNLYRRKGDFYNPFAHPINLFAVPAIAHTIDDTETITLIAEFYLQRGYYADALAALELLPPEISMLSEDILQKIGFCRQKTGDIAGAIDAFEKSELIDGRNKWTLRRLAFCHKAMGNPQNALPYFQRLLEMSPDDTRLLLNAGHCLMETGEYKKALNNYFKVEFIEEGTHKTFRPIAWCALLSGDIDRARTYYDKVANDNPSATDYLNIGHMNMVAGDYKAAVKSYGACFEKMNKDFDKMRELIDNDVSLLIKSGVDKLMIDIVLDEVYATLWN